MSYNLAVLGDGDRALVEGGQKVAKLLTECGCGDGTVVHDELLLGGRFCPVCESIIRTKMISVNVFLVTVV